MDCELTPDQQLQDLELYYLGNQLSACEFRLALGQLHAAMLRAAAFLEDVAELCEQRGSPGAREARAYADQHRATAAKAAQRIGQIAEKEGNGS